MKNFWQQLPRPFTTLAPLDGVTDVVFRQMITKLGKPDVLFTEFTSCEGLQSSGRERVGQTLLFKPNEQPIVAQVWGTDPQSFYETAKHIKILGFAGVDINMGCPVHAIIRDGACSALIKNHQLTADIIQATKEGAVGLPVSVKTRIGFETIAIAEWIGFLLQQDLAALTVHLRTAAEMSKAQAHWELMPEIMDLRKTYAPDTIVIGNGDITTIEEINKKYQQYGCEGLMIGREIFANPWLFNKTKDLQHISIVERFETFLEHIRLYETTWGESRNFANLKKFCKVYINQFPQAAKCREKIMETQSLKDLLKTVTTLQIEHLQ